MRKYFTFPQSLVSLRAGLARAAYDVADHFDVGFNGSNETINERASSNTSGNTGSPAGTTTDLLHLGSFSGEDGNVKRTRPATEGGASVTDLILIQTAVFAAAIAPASDSLSNDPDAKPAGHSGHTSIEAGNPNASAHIALDGNATVDVGSIGNTTPNDAADSNADSVAGDSALKATVPPALHVAADDTGLSPNNHFALAEASAIGSSNPYAPVHFSADANLSAGIATSHAGSGGMFTPTHLPSDSHIVVTSELEAAGNSVTASGAFTLAVNAAVPAAHADAASSPEMGVASYATTGSDQSTQNSGTSTQPPLAPTTSQSTHMSIVVNFDQAISSLPTAFVNAVNYVVTYFESLFTNPVTINLDVGYGEVGGSSLPSGALGSSMPAAYVPANYSDVKNALLAENAPGASTLPSTSPLGGTVYMYQAEAKALGLSSGTNLDGYVGFSNSVAWDYTTAAPSAGQYYLIGVIEHEITEVMGRVSLVNYQPSFYAPIDLYRYSSPGVHSTATGGSGSTAYFSIDNGNTHLGTWNNNWSNGDLG